jgi:hypothetical protein
MSRCVLSTCTPQRTPAQETPEHVQASTGLAPTPSDKMPASRFRYSPNISPRPCRDACLARAPHSAPPHSNAQETPAYASTGLAPTPPDKMPASRFRNSPNASPRPCRDARLAHAPPQGTAAQDTPLFLRKLANTRLHARAGTGLAPTPPDKLPASRFRYSPNAGPQSCRDACLARAPHSAPPHRRRLNTYRPVLALHPRPPIKCLHHDSDTARI